MQPVLQQRTWQSAIGLIQSASPAFGIMGILNISSDSFYDGGTIRGADDLLVKVSALLNAGADIIDIGAESTRPGAKALATDIELALLLPALSLIREHFPHVQVSIDSRKALPAAKCLELGADIINDVSGLQFDPFLLDVLSEWRPAYVLTHSQALPENMQKCPKYKDIISEICFFFEDALKRLENAGLSREHVALDPGIGFGKTLGHNLEILRNLERFLEFGRPLLLGLSMKSFFGQLLGHDLSNRLMDTALASALCWNKGVFWHRVHDPASVRDALRLTSALQKG